MCVPQVNHKYEVCITLLKLCTSLLKKLYTLNLQNTAIHTYLLIQINGVKSKFV